MQLVYTSEEILSEHVYAVPQEVAGHRLHGGFDAAGRYLSPRTLKRPQAVANWADALRKRGGEPLEIGLDLLSGPRYPNFEQQKLLLSRDLGQTLWNSLTTIGRVEARGRFLAQIPAPAFEGVVLGDTASMTLGHLGKGLFTAHGLDVGGLPDHGIGGHDVMWFAVRDLAFGANCYPLPDPPEAVGGPGAQAGERVMPDLSAGHEQILRFLMNLLMIEIRAFLIFDQNERLLRDPDLFTERRAEADEAAELVGRIRADEQVHVAYLCNLFGELRQARIRCQSGAEKPGHEIIDPAWDRQVRLSKGEGVRRQRAEMREVLHKRILQNRDGTRILDEFEALTDDGAFD